MLILCVLLRWPTNLETAQDPSQHRFVVTVSQSACVPGWSYLKPLLTLCRSTGLALQSTCCCIETSRQCFTTLCCPAAGSALRHTWAQLTCR